MPYLSFAMNKFFIYISNASLLYWHIKHLNVKFKGVNVLEDQNLRQGIKDFSDWPTIPQLYIKGEFIGGCDIVKDMFEKGELKKVLEEKKLI